MLSVMRKEQRDRGENPAGFRGDARTGFHDPSPAALSTFCDFTGHFRCKIA
jgi:hypothetical protein